MSSKYGKPLPFEPGYIFFVRGNGILDRIIIFVTAFWGWIRGRGWDAKWSHTGVVCDGGRSVFETTAWKTQVRDIRENYAGSYIAVLNVRRCSLEAAKARWNARVLYGFDATYSEQYGRIYPYWRLLLHLFGCPGLFHGRSKECSVLSASFLTYSGYRLFDSVWTYDPDKLWDELIEDGAKVVFEGSLRASGYMDEIEP